MASLGHIAVGMAAAKAYGLERPAGRSWLMAAVFWSLVSMLPDADVIGFAFGVNYGDEWGHRGATHSFAFSILLGAGVGLAAPLFRLPVVRTGITAIVVLISHALLDTLTNGGLGCALLWPFDLTRYFAPWNPIPVAPIGLYFFSPYGLMVATVELLLFAPLFWFARSSSTTADARRVRRRRAVGALAVGVWLVITWLLVSGDALRERVIGLALREDTEFGRRFSEEAFARVEIGQTEQSVRAVLGEPVYDVLVYPDLPDVCVAVGIDDNAVIWARPLETCKLRGIERSVSRAAVLQALGPRPDVCRAYTRSPTGRYYRLRAVCFANDRVAGTIRRWARD